MNEAADHEKHALVQMLQEAMGREIQLRSMLSKSQMDLKEAQAEIDRLKPDAPG